MVVVLVPATAIGANKLSNLFLPLAHVEQIVKTSGNLFASFLIQGGGFKFYQGQGETSESYIIKARLVGSARFFYKYLLEQYRSNGLVIWIFASSFGFDTGFIINTFEVNINNRELGIFNCTISMQKVQDQQPHGGL